LKLTSKLTIQSPIEAGTYKKVKRNVSKTFLKKKIKIKIFEVSNFETHHKEESNAEFDAGTYKRK